MQMAWEMGDPAERIRRLVELMRESGFTGMLIKSPANIFYFTGFRGPGYLLASYDGTATLYVYPIDYELAEMTASGEVQVSKLEMDATIRDVVDAVPDSVKSRLGFDYLSAEDYLEIAGRLGGSLAPASSYIWRLRMIKTPDEIEKIRRSCEIASRCMDLAVDLVDEGVMESEVKAEIIREMMRLGAEKPSFDIIVASGPRSSLPHGGPGDRMIRGGEVVVIDLGAVYEGYCSDLTRTVYVGSRPDERVLEVYEAVRRAKESAEASAALGVMVSALYERAFREIASRGYGEYFIHGLGHGVGIEIHEPPRIHRGADGVLSGGMIVTIEPGVYLPGRFGVRIEDTVLIREGGVDYLTSAKSDLLTR